MVASNQAHPDDAGMAATAPANSPARQRLLDLVARRQGEYDQASTHGRDYGDPGTLRAMLNLAQRALADFDAKAKKPAAAAPAAAAPTTVTPLPENRPGTPLPGPSPKAPVAVTDPEAAVAPTIDAAVDRADVALQQPIAAPAAAQPGKPAVEETEADQQRRRLAQRAFLGRTTGILTSVSGAAPSTLQIGVRKLLGGTA